jgi:hypothetical protein
VACGRRGSSMKISVAMAGRAGRLAVAALKDALSVHQS